MHATTIVQTAIQAWEEHNSTALASCLSDDVICLRILPQSIGKAQLLSSMKALTAAFPDWSFNGHILDEERLADRSWRVLFVSAVTGMQTGDLILPSLPIIPATKRKIALSFRHLEFLVTGDRITQISTDFSPSGLDEVLAQLGLELA